MRPDHSHRPCHTHAVTSQPPLFVDIDGVLNPYGVERPPGFIEHDLFPGEAPIRVCAEHGVWLRELSSRYHLVWGSSWSEADRALLAAMLDLPEFRGAVRLPSGQFDPAVKVSAVAEVARDRPLAWMDDLLTPEAWAWAERRASPTLLVPVDPAFGLTRAHVDRLLAWSPTQGDRGRSERDTVFSVTKRPGDD